MYVHEDKAHEVSAAIVKAEHSAKSGRLECWDQAGDGGLGPMLAGSTGSSAACGMQQQQVSEQ